VDIIADLLERHAREIPLWGHLPAAMRLKQAAVEALGVEAAFVALRGALGVPGLDRLERLPLAPMAGAIRARGAMVRELWAGAGAFERPPPRVVGGPPPAPMPGRGRDAWLACLDDVRARGRSSLLCWRGLALHDIEAGEGGFDDNPEYEPGLLHARDGTAWMMQAGHPAIECDEAFWLAGSHAVDFGHWVVEYLPKLMTARLAGLPEGIDVLVDALIPATVREALPAWLPRGCRLVNVPHLGEARVKRLWVAPAPHYPGFYATQWSEATWIGRSSEPRSFARLLGALREAVAEDLAAPTGRPRLLLARKPSRGKKKLLNHEAIEAIAIARGFERIYPEDHSLIEQLRLAAHATHVLAPEGSNNLLAFFARPGTRVATLSPPYTFPLVDVGAVLAALGVDFEVVVGPDEPTEEGFCAFWNDYRIDEARFAAWLDDWA